MVIHSLPLRINLISLGSLVGMSLILGISGASVVGANERRNAASRAELVASEIAGNAERMIAQGDEIDGLPGFDALCSSFVDREPMLGGAALFDYAGKKLYSGGKAEVPWPESRVPELERIGRAVLVGGGDRALHTVFRSGGLIAGYVVVSVEGGALAAAVLRSVLTMASVSALVVALLVVIQGLVFKRSLGASLARLVTTADSLASGDVGKAADLERYAGPDDVGRIYAAFARLVGRLLEAQAGLRAQNEELDATVRKRTEMLEGAYLELAGELKRRTALEAQLIQAKEEAEAADKAKSAFLAAMSHEIRTPMNSVLGYLDLLSRAILGPEERGHVEVIESNARHLLALIDDILDFSKIESGRLELADESFDPGEVFVRSAKMLELKAAEKGVALAIRADAAMRCRGDELRLGQVVVNLVSNAVKFTGTGGKVDAALEAARDGGAVSLSVSVTDTGIGIERERLGAIFEPFRQADPSIAGRYGGTGLGLSISSRIVESMGGKIEVESEPGKGSRFRFRISLPEAEAASEEAAARGGAGAAAAPAPLPISACAGMSVLVAEDTKDSRLLIVKMLGLLGLSVDPAADGAEALSLFEAKRYDVVILDAQMPVMGGVEAARRMRDAERERSLPRTPIIALSASVLAEDREEFRRAGADGFIAKPVSMSALSETLSRFACVAGGQEREVPGAAAAASVASRFGVDEAFAMQLVGEFSASLPGRIEVLEAALREGNADRLGRAAHGLRGSALNLGLDAIAEAAARAEEAASALAAGGAARTGRDGASEGGPRESGSAEAAVASVRAAALSFLAARAGP
jgi:signal transduction histidine kinase/CheY-like chemotaxis protein